MSVKAHTNKNRSAIVTYMIGICSAIALMVIGSLMCTYLTLQESIRLSDVSLILWATIFLSSAIGGLLCVKLSDKSPLISAGVCFAGILMCMAVTDMLLFTGIRGQLWGRGLAVLFGVVASVVTGMVKKPKAKYKKIRSR